MGPLTRLAGAALLTLGLAAPAVAQQGTVVWQIRGEMPDTVRAMTGGDAAIDLRVTAATEGSRAAFQMDFGPGMDFGPSVPFDFTQMRIQTIYDAAADSVSVGIIVPPELAAMAGGGIGFRFDLAVPDPAELRAMLPDSLIEQAEAAGEEDRTRFENTGRTSVVAGVTCEEWLLIAPDAVADENRVELCLAEAPPAMQAIMDRFKEILPDEDNPFTVMLERGRERFGGRNLSAMRMTIGGSSAMSMEVISMSDSSPGASFFELPIELQPFPLELFKGMAGAAATPQET